MNHRTIPTVVAALAFTGGGDGGRTRTMPGGATMTDPMDTMPGLTTP